MTDPSNTKNKTGGRDAQQKREHLSVMLILENANALFRQDDSIDYLRDSQP